MFKKEIFLEAVMKRLCPNKNPLHRYMQGYGTNLNITKFFSHPDFTVGFGIAPNQPSKKERWVADSTAGWELHPTPKNSI